MLLHVLANTRKVDNNRNVILAQNIPSTNTTQFEELRGLQGSAIFAISIGSNEGGSIAPGAKYNLFTRVYFVRLIVNFEINGLRGDAAISTAGIDPQSKRIT